MATYIVKRYGSNGANQPMSNEMVVGSIEAKSKIDAFNRFEEENPTVTIYANQYIEFIPISKASQDDIEASNEAGILNEVDGIYYDRLGNEYARKESGK